jgi:uncharacterized protein YbjQ (UPF0145 family)
MDNMQQISLALNFGVPLVILIVAYLVGNSIEKKHFRRIIRREKALHDFPVTTFQTLPSGWQVGRAEMVTGNVVVSLDYFKRIIAGLRGLVGGRIKTYEPLLERARREAILRMTERAKKAGYDAVINVRLETSRLANASGKGQGIAGIEMLAFGTAITLNQR